MDLFYSRHTLARLLKVMTNNCAYIIGTGKFNLIDTTNKIFAKKAQNLIKEMPWGLWLLVQAYNKVENYDNLYNKHVWVQKKVPKAKKVPFTAPTEFVSDKARYFLYKDTKTVIFYSNNLLAIPTKDIMMSNDPVAI